MQVLNYDIKTFSGVIGTTVTSLGLGAVPSGMKRWVTFLNIGNKYGGEQTVFVASTTSETYASTPTRASAAAKTRHTIQSKDTVVRPAAGPTDTQFPLFSIAAGAYLTALTTHGDANIDIQYYDN